MLNVLRENFKETPYLKWVLGLVGLGLVLYLGNYFIDSDSATASGRWVARVNGTEIPDWRYRDTAHKLDDYYRQMFGPNYEQFKKQLKIRDQALATVVQREMILQNARNLGLQTSDAEVAEHIRTHPSFMTEDGRFVGTARYQQAVDQSIPGGVAAFERGVAEDLLAEKWSDLVAQPIGVSDEELRDLFRRRTEKTTVDYVVVTSADQRVDQNVDPAALQSWYDGHRESYRRDEGRRVRYVVASRESLRAKVTVDAAEVQAYYDANTTRYVHPEERRARQILISVPAGASETERKAAHARIDQIAQRVRGNEDFAALARAVSEDKDSAEKGGDLGWLGRGRLFESVERAVFDTPVGQVAPVTETPHGLALIQVVDSRPQGQTPLAEVEASIRQALSLKKAEDLLTGEADRLRLQISSAAKLEEVARQEGLTVKSAFVEAGGRQSELAAGPEFGTAVMGLAPGEVSAPLRVAGGLAIVVVDENVPAGPAPLDDIRDRVRADVLSQRMTEAAMAAARRTPGAGADLAASAKALGLEVRSSGDLTPGQPLAGAGGPSPDLDARLFSAQSRVGDNGIVAVPAGVCLYRITGHTPYDPAGFETGKNALRQETLDERRGRYLQAVLDRMRTLQRIEVNQAVVDAIGPAS